MKFKKWLFGIIPAYGVMPLIFTFLCNSAVYGGSRLLTRNLHHYNLETALDLQIPFLPWTISIYFICYFFWAFNYILIIRQDKQTAYRFLASDVLAKCICFLCFLVFPTTNTRPEISGSRIWDHLMCFLYTVDAADNLFPSIHCLVSWFCYIGIRNRKNIPLLYRRFSFLFAIAVFLSTLTTKQHVLYDVAGGVFIAEICWWIAGHTGLGKRYQKIWESLNSKLPIIRKHL